MTRLVVTGGTGFIGRFVLDEVVDAGLDVHVFVRKVPRKARRDCTWHGIDLLRPDVVKSTMAAIAPETLLHLAWYAEPVRFWDGEENLTWVGASLELLRAFAESGGKAFIGVGTCAEYAWGGGPLREDGPLASKTLYASCKNAFRDVAQTYCRDRSIRFAWGRVFFSFGFGEAVEKFLTRMILDGLAGRDLVVREPDRMLDYIDVRDVAKALTLMVRDSDARGTYNIGTGEGRTVRSMAQQLVEFLHVPAERLVAKPESSAHLSPDVIADIGRLRALGWSPAIPFANALSDLIESYRE